LRKRDKNKLRESRRKDVSIAFLSNCPTKVYPNNDARIEYYRKKKKDIRKKIEK